MMRTVSVVEDNALYQQALVDVISSNPSYALHSVYSSAEGAMAMLHNPPDIAIVDINLPGKTGIELIATLRAQTHTQCVVCSMYEDDEHIVQALENGAVGYLLKEASVQDISNALDELVKGGAPMSPYIATRVISFFRKPKVVSENALLSAREKEVLQLVAEGLQYKEVANRLFLSTETVKKHMKNIYQKLHVQNKIEAVNKFRYM
ncbi:MAG: response regulator transcription factor [Bacteroidota bacterium]|nr:response regulator transcription factor [Bacteroidota bacterium]